MASLIELVSYDWRCLFTSPDHFGVTFLKNTFDWITRWWQLKYFSFSPLKLGKIPILTHIFQERVGSTTNQIISIPRFVLFGPLFGTAWKVGIFSFRNSVHGLLPWCSSWWPPFLWASWTSSWPCALGGFWFFYPRVGRVLKKMVFPNCLEK